MEFGLFTEFPSPPGVSEAAAFDEALGQMKAAEDLGFDAVWLAEIHFQKDRSVLASPLVIAAPAACRGRRDGRPSLQGTARIRRGPERAARALSGLQHPVQ
jgi:hypothetical protein